MDRIMRANTVRPPNNPTVFSLLLEATSLAKEDLKEVVSVCRNGIILTVGTGVLDCPNRIAAGASHPPYERGH